MWIKPKYLFHENLVLTNYPEIDDLIREYGGDILESERFKRAEQVTHHGTTSVAQHSIDVARYALMLCIEQKKQGKKVSRRDVVRAALLHDIGMTDDDISNMVSARKTYAHPVRSALIARKEYGANLIQVDAIRKHMWPLYAMPPSFTAGWILIDADKFCSVREVTVRNIRGGADTPVTLSD